MTKDERRGGCPRVHATSTDKERAKARRRRARYYALGLTSEGKPVKSAKTQAVALACKGLTHPRGCPCYDCLYPPTGYQPRILRVVT